VSSGKRTSQGIREYWKAGLSGGTRVAESVPRKGYVSIGKRTFQEVRESPQGRWRARCVAPVVFQRGLLQLRRHPQGHRGPLVKPTWFASGCPSHSSSRARKGAGGTRCLAPVVFQRGLF
jgi:hypothetical protein